MSLKQTEFSSRGIVSNLPLPNTLGLPATAAQALTVTTSSELQAAMIANAGSGLFVLGGGSNVVLPNSLGGLTVLMRIKGICESSADPASERRHFVVGAGESWQGFVRFCLGQGLGGGIENLTLIPGTVGAAPIQNIGAYGVEVAEFVHSVEVFDVHAPEKGGQWFAADDCEFGYRDSLFKRTAGRWVITRVRFAMPTHVTSGPPRLGYAGIRDELSRMGARRFTPAVVSEAVARLRRSKLPDPRHMPNAGSFFKNPQLPHAEYERLLAAAPSETRAVLDAIPRWAEPAGVKLAAAALIERAGFKQKPGKSVRVWYRQPLVLVNFGSADAAELHDYAQQICDAVQEKFGVVLEQEPVNIESGPR